MSQVREQALDAALRLHSSGGVTPAANVVKSAELFFAFLTGKSDGPQIVLNISSPDLTNEELVAAIRKVQRSRGQR